MSYYCESPPEFYTERRVKARKPHKCCETHRIIQTGEFYWRCVGKWDGKVSVMAQCEGAYHFARFLNGVGKPYDQREECIDFGGVSTHLDECCNDATLLEEWRRVCDGEITRTT